ALRRRLLALVVAPRHPHRPLFGLDQPDASVRPVDLFGQDDLLAVAERGGEVLPVLDVRVGVEARVRRGRLVAAQLQRRLPLDDAVVLLDIVANLPRGVLAGDEQAVTDLAAQPGRANAPAPRLALGVVVVAERLEVLRDAQALR